MKILGVDPGVFRTGYAIISVSKISSAIKYGTFQTDKNQPLGERIKSVVQRLQRLIKREKVKLCAMETLFFKKDAVKSVMQTLQLRGAILYFLAKENIALYEITPARLKLAVTGQGRASKRQMNYMVRSLFNIKDNLQEDEADALACAYYLREMLKRRL